MRYVNEHFRDRRVTLDGNEFEACRFTNVQFDYAGGPVTLNGCQFDGFTWRLGGNLGRGLAMLGALYSGKQSAGLSLIAKAMFPKPAEPAGPAQLPPSIAKLFEDEAREEAEAAAQTAEPFDYSRLRASIRRGPKMPGATGYC